MNFDGNIRPNLPQLQLEIITGLESVTDREFYLANWDPWLIVAFHQKETNSLEGQLSLFSR